MCWARRSLSLSLSTSRQMGTVGMLEFFSMLLGKASWGLVALVPMILPLPPAGACKLLPVRIGSGMDSRLSFLPGFCGWMCLRVCTHLGVHMSIIRHVGGMIRVYECTCVLVQQYPQYTYTHLWWLCKKWSTICLFAQQLSSLFL